MKGGSDSSGAWGVEMRIPAGLIPRFKAAEGRKIGLLLSVKTAAEDNGWILSGSPGDTRECTLVSKKFASLKPLNLGFDLLDARVARGEEIVGKFHLTNAGVDTLDLRSFVLAGEGKGSDYLSSLKIRLEGLPPKKHISHEIRSVIPSDMPLGSWALGAEVKSVDGTAALQVPGVEKVVQLPSPPPPTVFQQLGGVAVMNKQPEKPIHEFLISIAGPLVNVVIALILAIPVGAQVRMSLLDGRGLLPDVSNDPSLNTLLFWLFSANISLVVFNLIPAFPLDGGRILRSLLGWREFDGRLQAGGWAEKSPGKEWIGGSTLLVHEPTINVQRNKFRVERIRHVTADIARWKSRHDNAETQVTTLAARLAPILTEVLEEL